MFREDRNTSSSCTFTHMHACAHKLTDPHPHTCTQTLLLSSLDSILTSIHIVQSIGHTIQVLEEVIIVDVFCLRAHSVLVAEHPDVWVDVTHCSCSSLRL